MCKKYQEIITPLNTNMTVENPPWMKMYFLLKMVDFPASYVSFQGCSWSDKYVADIAAIDDCKTGTWDKELANIAAEFTQTWEKYMEVS